MHLNDYEELCDLQYKGPIIDIYDLPDVNKTLIYGYTLERHTFHAYTQDSMICIYVYTPSIAYAFNEKRDVSPLIVHSYKCGTMFSASDFIPSKRVCPERSDYDFCKLLISKGAYIPFTCYEPDHIIDAPYKGLLK